MSAIRSLRVMGVIMILAGAAFWSNFHNLAATLGFASEKSALQGVGGLLILMGVVDFVAAHILRRRMR